MTGILQTILSFFGVQASSSANYIEDVFSTYLYTGNGSTQTITNGIDLSGKGGLVWIKSRSAATNNFLFDTVRGTTDELNTNTTDAEASLANSLTAFNSDGFSIGSATGIGVNAATYVSWTFRKQAKFFDVVTWSGNSTAGRTIPHNLGSVPGCIIVKCTSNITDWAVYHRSLSSAANALQLNTTGAQITATTYWNSTAPTSSVFTVGADNDVNATGRTYVAYLFAHDAGGFGAAGTDNVISCGSYTGNGSTQTVSLGYEPQFLMYKQATGTGGDWMMFDIMRGLDMSTSDKALFPNSSSAESGGDAFNPTATGFVVQNNAAWNASGQTYIYIAIRRGPMRTPTSGTSVFTPATRTGTGTTGVVVTDATFPIDLVIGRGRAASNPTPIWIDRLRGATVQLRSDNTDAEAASTIMSSLASQTGWIGSTSGTGAWNTSAVNYIQWYFRRAPGFFDVVCYTGTGANRTVSHNLGVAPELMIVKCRSAINDWAVYANNDNTDYLLLNSTAATADDNTYWNDTSPTSSVFSVGTNADVNTNTATYVAYLFASVSGVSKVGSYTGNGSNQTINCGFTAGARFVLIKRTDSTGDWYVWDSARGIVAGNDPYLLLNSTAAEVTNTDYVDTSNAGFEISSTAPAAINANGGTFIFLAIA
jgi:hypothetical protein